MDIACSKLYAILNQHFHHSVPLRCTKTRSFPCWFTTKSIRLIKVKRHYLKMFRLTRQQNYNLKFKEHRKLVKSNIKHDYGSYLSDISDSVTRDPKKMWSFINNMKNETRIPGSMTVGETVTSMPQNITNAFAAHFQSVYLPAIPSPLGSGYSNTSTITVDELTEPDFLDAVSEMKAGFSAGPDSIPAFLVRDCRYVLMRPLLHIFNLILKTAVYPECWKTSKITPVYKSGGRGYIKNYRPISLICNFSKIFEKMLFKPLFNQRDR